MSSIEALWIEGVRSFSHDKPVRLRFYKPVTVILGQNGAGKTTIIESLKYASCGELPPNCKQSFVHDPKIAGQPEVKAQVKMTFIDIKGDKLTAIRSMKATQKPSKIEQRTLDNVLKQEGGEQNTITSRCADMDQLMVEHLGVSDAVLTNVIFCHQEDSSWPMAQPTEVKKKFDRIFSATRYIKALEEIKKTRLAEVAKVKEYKIELQHLTRAKDHATTLRDKIEEMEGRNAATRSHVTEVNQKLEPVQVRLAEIEAIFEEVIRQDKRLGSLKAKKGQIEETWSRMKRSVSTVYDVSMDELERMHADLRNQVKRDEERLAKEKSNLTVASQKLRELSQQKDDVLKEHGKLQQEYVAHEKETQERDGSLVQLARKVNMPGYDGHVAFTSGQVAQFFEEIQGYVNRMKGRGKALREENGAKALEFQSQIDDVKRELTGLDESEKLKKKLHSENVHKLKQIEFELKSVEASTSRLGNLKQDLEASERELQEEKDADMKDTFTPQIDRLKVQKRAADEEIRRLTDELQAINMQAGIRGALDQMRKERRSKEEEMSRIEMTTSEDLFELKSSESSVRQIEEKERYIGSQIKQKESALRSTRESVKYLTSQLGSKSGQLEQLEYQWKQKERDLKAVERSVIGLCPDGDVQSAISSITKEISEKERNFALVATAADFFKKYHVQLRKRHACPLCERAVGPSDEEQLAAKFLEKIDKAPHMQQKSEQELARLREKLVTLQRAEPSLKMKTEVSALKLNVEKLKSEKREQEERLEEAREIEASLTAEEAALRKDEQSVRDLMRYKRDLTDLESRIARHESKLVGGTKPERTAQLVNNELQDHQMTSEQAGRQIEQKRNAIADAQRRINDLEAQVNGLRSEKFQVEARMQNKSRLEDQRTDYTLANQQFEREVQETNRKRRPLQAKLENLERERSTFVDAAREQEDQLQRQVDRLYEEKNSVARKHQSVAKFLEARKDVQLSKCDERKKEIESQVRNLEGQKTSTDDRIQKLNKSLASTQLKEREIQDNIGMKRLEEEVVGLNGEIDALKRQRGGADYEAVTREKKRLEDEQETLRRDRAKAEGKQKQLDEELRGRRAELRTDLYRDVDQRHKEKFIDAKTTEIATQDLDKYYKALDRAVMKFHSLKMREINKILSDLWKKTYKGGDIDTIRIECDEDIAQSGTRKTYKYRVVMVKGSTELEMRGRCSTGQKVLAAILIRLALAETFCINCGVIALDEPTSNLDEENRESLAEALLDLIKARQGQANFQMIVITHDEDFVDMLSRAESIDYFYRVDRDDRGDSRIFRHHLKGQPGQNVPAAYLDQDEVPYARKSQFRK